MGVLVFALVTFSSFVSSITNAMTRLRNMNSEYAKQLLTFQRFLRQSKITTPLAVRMRRHLEHRLFRQKKILEEKDVEVLKLLSEPLLMELHVEIYKPCLVLHPFLQRFTDHLIAIRKICHLALFDISLSLHDTLFSYGEACERMYFLRTGRLIYTLEFNWQEFKIEQPKEATLQKKSDRASTLGCMGSTPNDDTLLGSDHCLAEACLWTQWAHLGACVCKTGKASLICLDSQTFRNITSMVRWIRMEATLYAKFFAEHLNCLDTLSDLVCTEDTQELNTKVDMALARYTKSSLSVRRTSHP